jgi:hypothetical protein
MIVGKGRSAFLLAFLVAPIVAGRAEAFSKLQIKCSVAIGKAGLALVRAKLKLEQNCRNANLAEPGSCTAPDTGAIAKIDAKLHDALLKHCMLPSEGLVGIGFPGPCTDANPADGFTVDDLSDCIRTSHDTIVGKMLALEYDATVTGPLSKEDRACQMTVGKESAAFTACELKSVQACRAQVMKGKLPGVPAHLCATADAKTAATIAKCRDKLGEAIVGACTDSDVASLAVCTPDVSTAASAGPCLADAHTVLIDTPAIDVPADLIDYEYAVRGGLCGDGAVNNVAEECDGTDDAACPGSCGDPNGYFACLCTNTPRIRVVEHKDADTDNGWTGNSADTGVAEGGGYLGDLYDCDGSGLCNVGPSCSLAPHAPCNVLLSAASGVTGDQICAYFGEGTCRKRRTATGPHCFSDIQKKCDPNLAFDPVCDSVGDSCVTTLVAPPNPVSSGGVSVCNVTIFSEDVVGTVNVLTGESTVRAPQRSRTYSRSVGAANKPCPVCGGFCGVSRERCATDDECAGKGPCLTVAVCSDGPNAGKQCRTTPPFGSTSTFFGTTSVDCPPDPRAEITSQHGLDLYVTNRTTGGVGMLPSVPCTSNGYSGNACLGGTSAGRPCTTASECPGGSCGPQCFCDGQVSPNACNAACVGGPNDGIECIADSECPGGFCHAGDCRVDPNDHDSIQEGICTTGPAESWCSITDYVPCSTAAQCQPPACPYCQTGEACVSKRRACFVNSGIVRQGSPRTPEGVSVGIYCIDGDKDAVNTVAGFPGPAAFTQPERQIVVP